MKKLRTITKREALVESLEWMQDRMLEDLEPVANDPFGYPEHEEDYDKILSINPEIVADELGHRREPVRPGGGVVMKNAGFIRFAVARIQQKRGDGVRLVDVPAQDFIDAYRQFEFFTRGTDDVDVVREALKDEGERLYQEATGCLD
jgi:hypothetical protein